MSSHHHHHHKYNNYASPYGSINLKNILGKVFNMFLNRFLSSNGLLARSDNEEDSNSNGSGLINNLFNFANGFNNSNSNNNYRGEKMSSNKSSKNTKNDKDINTSELGDTLNAILQNIDMNQILQILTNQSAEANNKTKQNSSSNNNGQNPLASLLNSLTSEEVLAQLTEAINKTKENK